MKTELAFVLLTCLALSIVGCSTSSRTPIVGKWETGQADDKFEAEFTPDGKSRITAFGKTFEGTYRLNGDELEWMYNGMTTKSKVKVSATELELTTGSKTVTYKRM